MRFINVALCLWLYGFWAGTCILGTRLASKCDVGLFGRAIDNLASGIVRTLWTDTYPLVPGTCTCGNQLAWCNNGRLVAKYSCLNRRLIFYSRHTDGRVFQRSSCCSCRSCLVIPLVCLSVGHIAGTTTTTCTCPMRRLTALWCEFFLHSSWNYELKCHS